MDRVKMQVTKDGGNYLTRHYLGGVYEIDEKVGASKEKLYLGGGYYHSPAVYVKENGVWRLHYICRDYLGSITHITDHSGKLLAEYSYDAWGRMRNPVSQNVYAPGGEPELLLGRGYTGHEHLSFFGLVNMNARLYDPLLGRFLSPDPFVQLPDNLRSLNRYGYGMCNPLCYVDENGEFWWIVAAAVVGEVVNAAIHSDQIHSVGSFFGYFGVGAAAGALSAVTGGALTGAIGGLSGVAGGAIVGAGSGAVGGAVLGAGNVAMDGGNFGDILSGGLSGAASGALSGAAMGGAESKALGAAEAIRDKIRLAFRVAMIITFPCFMGLFFLAEDVAGLIYNAPNAAGAIQTMSIGILFLGLHQISTGVLQGLGRTAIPVGNMILACVVKVALGWWLTAIPALGIKGASIATVADFAVAAVLNMFFIYRLTGFSLSMGSIIRPMLASGVMGCVIYAVLAVTGELGAWSVLFAMVAAVPSYGGSLLAVGGLGKEDLQQVPFIGRRMLALGQRFGLFK